MNIFLLVIEETGEDSKFNDYHLASSKINAIKELYKNWGKEEFNNDFVIISIEDLGEGNQQDLDDLKQF